MTACCLDRLQKRCGACSRSRALPNYYLARSCCTSATAGTLLGDGEHPRTLRDRAAQQADHHKFDSSLPTNVVTRKSLPRIPAVLDHGGIPTAKTYNMVSRYRFSSMTPSRPRFGSATQALHAVAATCKAVVSVLAEIERRVIAGAGSKVRVIALVPAWRATLCGIGPEIQHALQTCCSEEACLLTGEFGGSAVRIIARFVGIKILAPSLFRHVVGPCPHLLLGG